ncbi:MAG: hypothetical protein H8E57_01465 [Candidatus Cloacimonetes bacterium]|nr:hypothetical protein [Candidatus Cloacimonadota bacterium]
MNEQEKKAREVIEEMLPDDNLENSIMQKLSDEINLHFKGFEFPKDFIKSRINEKGDFILRIGWRDLHLDKNANLIGSGTDLELIDEYEIIKN